VGIVVPASALFLIQSIQDAVPTVPESDERPVSPSETLIVAVVEKDGKS
jgi:hypothetical protein